MSIKAYLRSALKAFVGQESVPAYQTTARIDYGSSTTGTVGASGLLVVRVITTSGSTPWASIDVNSKTVCNANGSWFVSGGMTMNIPCRKGDTYNIFSAGVRIESVCLYPTAANIV